MGGFEHFPQSKECISNHLPLNGDPDTIAVRREALQATKRNPLNKINREN
jgi:5-formyltetrahydrofolate cyclo-ligase